VYECLYPLLCTSTNPYYQNYQQPGYTQITETQLYAEEKGYSCSDYIYDDIAEQEGMTI
jgi:hypothetical protein